MDTYRTCPFCGGRAFPKRPLLDKMRLGGRVAGTGLSLRARSKETYLHCNGCTIDFVRADRDIKTIEAGLRIDPRAALQIKHYHGEDVTVYDLLHSCVTGMARMVRPGRSLASVSVDKDELLVCFLHRGIRTFGSLVRRRDRNGGYHYVLTGLSKA